MYNRFTGVTNTGKRYSRLGVGGIAHDPLARHCPQVFCRIGFTLRSDDFKVQVCAICITGIADISNCFPGTNGVTRGYENLGEMRI